MSRLRAYPFECLNEFDVEEITPAGVEKLKSPLDPAESFEALANRLDFDEKEQETQDEKAEKQQETNRVANEQNIFRKAFSAVNSALTETMALIDILSVAKDRHYLLLEPIYLEPQEDKLSFMLSGKKTSLNHVADILLKGAERLLHNHSQQADNNKTQTKTISLFHDQLATLRKNWRLRYINRMIVGDFGIHFRDSQLRANTNFEVREIPFKVATKGTNSSGSTNVSTTVMSSQALETTETPGPRNALRCLLQFHQATSGYLDIAIVDNAYFHHVVNRTRTTLVSGVQNEEEAHCEKNTLRDMPPEADMTSQQLLIAARDAMIRREVFHRLSLDVANLSSEISSVILRDHIICTILPNVHVSIRLTDNISTLPYQEASVSSSSIQGEFSLSLLLRCLLLRHSRDHATASIATTINCEQTFAPAPKPPSLLTHILDVCRHRYLRQRVRDVLSRYAATCRDPVLTLLTAPCGDALQSSLRIRMTTRGYQGFRGFRSECALQVSVHGRTGIAVLDADGCAAAFGFDVARLLDWVKEMTGTYMITLTRTLSTRIHGLWQVMVYGSQPKYARSPVQDEVFPAVCLLHSYGHEKFVCVASTGTSQQVYVGHGPIYRSFTSLKEMNSEKKVAVGDEKMDSDTPERMRSVNLAAIRGASSMQKIEMILAALTAL